MSARLKWWLHEWDWRPMTRLIVWLALAVAAAKRSGYQPPSLGAVARELVLGCLLTFGLLTRLQIWLALGAVRLFMALDDGTYALAEWLVRPVARAPFAVNFLAALAVQLALVFGSLFLWTSADLGPQVLAALEAALTWALKNISKWL